MDTLPHSSKRYSRVIDLVRDLHKDSPEFVKEVEERIDAMDIGYSLASARSQNGVSESEMAERLGCDEAKIWAMEYARNESVKVGDMIDYAKALDTNFFLRVVGSDDTVVDEIEFYAFELQCRVAELNKSLESSDRPFLEITSIAVQSFVEMIRRFVKSRHQDGEGVEEPESAFHGEQLAFTEYLDPPSNYHRAVVR